ncbi:MAG: outer membrane beta-barrel protein, partial [Ignavibacteriaceae bacterium]|nr:outer membrane beta-barrel protein [Ignavibacteriaceae bacterium]
MRLLISILLFLSLTTVSIAQYQNINQLHPLSGKSSLGIEGGISYIKSDFRESEIDLLGRLSFEYFFQSTNPGVFGFEGFIGGGFLSARNGEFSPIPAADYVRTNILYAGVATTYNIALSKKFMPYLSAGLSYLYFEPEVKDNE